MGMGTTFKIYLPVSRNAIQKDSLKEKEASVPGTERILVVDDDEIVREFVSDTLEFHQYTITLASNGKEALEKIDNGDKPFDLVLTDVIMSHMDGWQLCEEVRRRDPSAKVLFMSGYDDRKLPKDSIKNDPQLSFIAKPLMTSSLITEMRRLLDS